MFDNFSEIWCLQKLKTNSLPPKDCRGLVHLFCYRCLQMWSADCRRFTSEKTNNTLISPTKPKVNKPYDFQLNQETVVL
ncbi:hypothetical protein Hanom_Chr05g00463781 [Helianthus anomalus]